MPLESPPTSESPLAGLSLALVGPGRVGTSLAYWAVAAGAGVVAVAGRTRERATAVARELEALSAASAELDSSGADLLLIAVSDPSLDRVARDLARRPQAPVALHTAGSRGAEALAPLRETGCAVGSLHPLKAFPRPLTDPAEAAGTFFAVDGAPDAVATARRLAGAFGGTAGEVPEELRPLYHLAASVAAGGVTTLVASAADLARSLGLPDAVAHGYLELARGALAGAARQLEGAAEDPEADTADRLAAAITGPVTRGDAGLLTRQLALLRRRSGERERIDLLARLALETARLAGGRHAGMAGEGAGEEARERALEALREALAPFLDSTGDGC